MKHALEDSGEIVLYPSSPFQTIQSAFKEGQALTSACSSGNRLLKIHCNVQVEFFSCTLAWNVFLLHLLRQR